MIFLSPNFSTTSQLLLAVSMLSPDEPNSSVTAKISTENTIMGSHILSSTQW